MQTRRLVIALAVLLSSVLVTSVSAAEESTTAKAILHAVNKSGVQGEIGFFTEPGGQVLVTGTATGLEPSQGRYISLVYDLGSVPGGPVACEPTVDQEGMFVGIWAVDERGNGTLIQVNRDVAPLSAIDSVSIRDTTVNGGIGPEAVVACGQIAVKGGR